MKEVPETTNSERGTEQPTKGGSKEDNNKPAGHKGEGNKNCHRTTRG